MTTPSTLKPISDWEFEQYVQAEVDGEATPEQLAVLEADRVAWRAALAEPAARRRGAPRERARSLRGDEREQVIADLESEQRRIAAAWARHNEPAGPRRTRGAASTRPARSDSADAPRDDAERDDARSRRAGHGRSCRCRGNPDGWSRGRPVASERNVDGERLAAMLAAAGAPASGWTRHEAGVAAGRRARRRARDPRRRRAGLAGRGRRRSGRRRHRRRACAGSGRVAIWAVELTAHGAMVPLLRQRKRRERQRARLERLVLGALDAGARRSGAARPPGRDACPASCCALDPNVDARALTRSALTGMVDAICRDSARRLEVPGAAAARPHRDRRRRGVPRAGSTAARSTRRCASRARSRRASSSGRRSVTGERERLDRAARSARRRQRVASRGVRVGPEGRARPDRAGDRRTRARAGRDLEDEIARLERMLPALLRPGRHAARPGHPEPGRGVGADGHHRVRSSWPPASTCACPRCRGASRRRRCACSSTRRRSRWSARTNSPTCAGRRCSTTSSSPRPTSRGWRKEARPLIRSGGRWVAIDQADLAGRGRGARRAGRHHAAVGRGDAAPRARHRGLAARGRRRRRRRRLGRRPARGRGRCRRRRRPARPTASSASCAATRPKRWRGSASSTRPGSAAASRSTWASARRRRCWRTCSPARAPGPALVIAPPAVVGNWTAEAARFTPEPARRRAPRRATAPRPTRSRPRSPTPTSWSPRTEPRCATSTRSPRCRGRASCSTRRRRSRTRPTTRRSSCAASRPRSRIALTGTPIENGLGDLWAILDFANPGLVGPRPQFIARLSSDGTATRVEAEDAMRALNGILVFRRTKAEPDDRGRAARPDRRARPLRDDARADRAVPGAARHARHRHRRSPEGEKPRKGQILAAITALKQICNHPSAYQHDDRPLAGRSGKLARLEEIVDAVFAAGEQRAGVHALRGVGPAARRAPHRAHRHAGRRATTAACRAPRATRSSTTSRRGEGPGALVLSLKAGGTGLNLTAASHVVLYDRWWNPAVEDQARDRAWRIGQTRTVICHRLICPGTVDERVEEVVAGKRRIADLVLPKSSSLADLDSDQLRARARHPARRGAHRRPARPTNGCTA